MAIDLKASTVELQHMIGLVNQSVTMDIATGSSNSLNSNICNAQHVPPLARWHAFHQLMCKKADLPFDVQPLTVLQSVSWLKLASEWQGH